MSENCISDKELVFKICKELLQLNKEKTEQFKTSGQMSQTFPKDTPVPNKHMLRMFYIIVGMQVETSVRFPIKNIGMATAKMPPHSQCCEDWKKTGTLIYH